METVRTHAAPIPEPETSPEVEALVIELIHGMADRWTLSVLDALETGGTLRFTQLSRAIPGVSQKMLTQTLRRMERDGMVTRTVHPVVPPRVEYALTPMGLSFSAAFCGVWMWAMRHEGDVARARRAFDARDGG